jgi:hypothetical protein
MKKGSQYNGFDVGFKVQKYVHGDHDLAHENAYDLATHYDGHLLLYLLIHYYNLLMPIMFDEVQVHSFDFDEIIHFNYEVRCKFFFKEMCCIGT